MYTGLIVSGKHTARRVVLHIVTGEDTLEDGPMAYAAYVPKLRPLAAASSGRTCEEAPKDLQEATELPILNMIPRGDDLPEGARPSDQGL
jgi:hypothetical protein